MAANNNNSSDSNQLHTAIAIFDFEGDFNADQISFHRGDRLILNEISHEANLAKGEVVQAFPEHLGDFQFSENAGWFPYNLVIDIEEVAQLRREEIESAQKFTMGDTMRLEERLHEILTPTSESAPATIAKRPSRKIPSLVKDPELQNTLRKQLSVQLTLSKSASQLFTSNMSTWEKCQFFSESRTQSTGSISKRAKGSLQIGATRNLRFSQLNLEDEEELKMPDVAPEANARSSIIVKGFNKLTKEEKARRIPKNFLAQSMKSVPKIKLTKPNSQTKLHIALSGPSAKAEEALYLEKIFAKTVSTYPWPRNDAKRMGDPVCDRYSIEVHSNALVACVADGCSWGLKPREAAFRAAEAFISHMQRRITETTKVGHAYTHLVDALEFCHETIIRNKDDIWDAGTTTLIGGVLLETDEKDSNYVFVCINVGDCKAFHYSKEKGTMTDITAGNRPKGCDTRDPGGRLGPHSRTGNPDFRNLQLYAQKCKKGDIICLVSDGVHDNLDPQLRGLMPKDIGCPEYSSWEQMDQNEKLCQHQKSLAMCKYWLSLLPEGEKQPGDFVQAALQNSINVTQNTRTWVENTPQKRVPVDYTKYPGKLDHTTCLA